MDAVKAFNAELAGLYECKPPISKAKMTTITKTAIRAIKYYKHIVQSVEKFIQKCKTEYKIPGLYVIDSIVRQSRHQFTADRDVFAPRFAKNINITMHFIFKCPQEDKSKVIRVLNLWQKNHIFGEDVIQPLFDLADPDHPLHKEIATKLSQKVNKKESQHMGYSPPFMPSSPPRSSHQDFLQHGEPSIAGSSGIQLTTEESTKVAAAAVVSSLDASLLQQIQKILLHKTAEEPSGASVQHAPHHLPPPSMLTSQAPPIVSSVAGLMSQNLHLIPPPQIQPVISLQSHVPTSIPVHVPISGPPPIYTLPPMSVAHRPDGVAGFPLISGMPQDYDGRTLPFLPPMDISQPPPGYLQPFPPASSTNSVPVSTELVTEPPPPQAPAARSPKEEGEDSDSDVIDVPNDSKDDDIFIVEDSRNQSRSRSQSRSINRKKKRKRSKSRSHSKHRRSSSRSRKKSRDKKERSRRDRSIDYEKESEKDKERKRKGLPRIKRDNLSVCSTTLWVGHLSRLVMQSDLSDAFGEIGDIISIDLIPPRGCAFICMNRRMDAAKALSKLKNCKIQNKSITIAWAPGKGVKEKKELKDYWEVESGCTYIPYSKLKKLSDMELQDFEDGGAVDEDTVPDWLKGKFEGPSPIPVHLMGPPPGLLPQAGMEMISAGEEFLEEQEFREEFDGHMRMQLGLPPNAPPPGGLPIEIIGGMGLPPPMEIRHFQPQLNPRGLPPNEPQMMSPQYGIHEVDIHQPPPSNHVVGREQIPSGLHGILTGSHGIPVGAHKMPSSHGIPVGAHEIPSSHGIPVGAHEIPSPHGIPVGAHEIPSFHGLQRIPGGQFSPEMELVIQENDSMDIEMEESQDRNKQSTPIELGPASHGKVPIELGPASYGKVLNQPPNFAPSSEAVDIEAEERAEFERTFEKAVESAAADNSASTSTPKRPNFTPVSRPPLIGIRPAAPISGLQTTPRHFSAPPQEKPRQFVPPQEKPRQFVPPQEKPRQFVPPQEKPRQFAPLQGEPRQFISPQRDRQFVSSQEEPNQFVSPQESRQFVPPQGEPRQFAPLQGEPRQFVPPQGEPRQFAPLQGEPRQFAALQGKPRQFVPPQGEPRQFAHLQGEPRQFVPPQGEPRQFVPPQGEPRQFAHLQGNPRHFIPPQGELPRFPHSEMLTPRIIQERPFFRPMTPERAMGPPIRIGLELQGPPVRILGPTFIQTPPRGALIRPQLVDGRIAFIPPGMGPNIGGPHPRFAPFELVGGPRHLIPMNPLEMQDRCSEILSPISFDDRRLPPVEHFQGSLIGQTGPRPDHHRKRREFNIKGPLIEIPTIDIEKTNFDKKEVAKQDPEQINNEQAEDNKTEVLEDNKTVLEDNKTVLEDNKTEEEHKPDKEENAEGNDKIVENDDNNKITKKVDEKTESIRSDNRKEDDWRNRNRENRRDWSHERRDRNFQDRPRMGRDFDRGRGRGRGGNWNWPIQTPPRGALIRPGEWGNRPDWGPPNRDWERPPFNQNRFGREERFGRGRIFGMEERFGRDNRMNDFRSQEERSGEMNWGNWESFSNKSIDFKNEFDNRSKSTKYVAKPTESDEKPTKSDAKPTESDAKPTNSTDNAGRILIEIEPKNTSESVLQKGENKLTDTAKNIKHANSDTSENTGSEEKSAPASQNSGETFQNAPKISQNAPILSQTALKSLANIGNRRLSLNQDIKNPLNIVHKNALESKNICSSLDLNGGTLPSKMDASINETQSQDGVNAAVKVPLTINPSVTFDHTKTTLSLSTSKTSPALNISKGNNNPRRKNVKPKKVANIFKMTGPGSEFLTTPNDTKPKKFQNSLKTVKITIKSPKKSFKTNLVTIVNDKEQNSLSHSKPTLEKLVIQKDLSEGPITSKTGLISSEKGPVENCESQNTQNSIETSNGGR